MQSTIKKAFWALTMFVSSLPAWASEQGPDWAQRSEENMRPGVTAVSQSVYDLHMDILLVCTVIGLLVFGAILWSVVYHRRSKNPEPATFHEHLGLEILWTVIPFIILILMAIPATKTLKGMSDTSDADIVVKVTASQWKWHYEYLVYGDDSNIGVGFYSNLSTPRSQISSPVSDKGLFPYSSDAQHFGSTEEKGEYYLAEVDRHLMLPEGKKVLFLITSDDVIHSFWVPDFGVKKDAIPGFVNEAWALPPIGSANTYRGFCAELCGKDHAFMPIAVDVVPQEQFDTWLAEEKAAAAAAPDLTPFSTMEDAIASGEDVYARSCATCHGANGEGGIGPAFAGSDLATNPERKVEHINILLNGQNAMPSFKAMLTPRDLAAVITFERNAWGNESGDLVQPEDVVE